MGTPRGVTVTVTVTDYDYALMDLTVYGRQALREDSASGRPQTQDAPRSTPCAPTAARPYGVHVPRQAVRATWRPAPGETAR
ncbi:hypothetical protein GCM10010231_28690 [Streptomyces sindenensis]|nr:hypothetical protein GCM10010231_28690 [Streptomyces sindenensis]